MRGIARWLVFGSWRSRWDLWGFAVSGVAVANPAPACFNGYVQPLEPTGAFRQGSAARHPAHRPRRSDGGGGYRRRGGPVRSGVAELLAAPGQARQPCSRWTFLATAICSSRLAWSAEGRTGGRRRTASRVVELQAPL